MPKTKLHTQYRLKNGTLVPGTTTVLSILDKPAIHFWIAKLTREGQDWTKVRDQAADIGTISHYLILCDLKGGIPDLSAYAQADIEKAHNAIRSYKAWKAHNDVIPIGVEESLVSEKWGYGGTFDLLANINGVPTICDFKTSGALYDDYSTQIAAYAELVRECKHLDPQGKLIRINKGNNDDFESKTVDRLDKRFELFRHLLRVYTLQRELT